MSNLITLGSFIVFVVEHRVIVLSISDNKIVNRFNLFILRHIRMSIRIKVLLAEGSCKLVNLFIPFAAAEIAYSLRFKIEGIITDVAIGRSVSTTEISSISV